MSSVVFDGGDDETETECDRVDGGDGVNVGAVIVEGCGCGFGCDCICGCGCGCLLVRLDICERVEIIELVKSLDLLPIAVLSSALLLLIAVETEILVLLIRVEEIATGGLDG